MGTKLQDRAVWPWVSKLSALPKAFPIIISVCALGLSGANYYNTFLRSHHSLSATVVGVHILDGSVQVNVALANSGTSGTVLADLEVLFWAADTKRWMGFADESFQPVVIPESQMTVATVEGRFTAATLPLMFSPEQKTGREFVVLGLRLVASDIFGKRFQHHVEVAYHSRQDLNTSVLSATSNFPWEVIELLREGASEFPPPFALRNP